jgi:NAD(P)-dependent dehydrogenase (short-subunit alcohol dehydrogenase family)
VRVSLVTGAGSGIGAATAAALAGRGDRVVCADLDGAAAERVAAGLDGAGSLQLDVRDPAATDAAVTGIVKRHGRLDVAVACAGIEMGGPAHELDPAVFARVVEVNLHGSFLTARAAARAMIGRGGGRVVLIGSVNSAVALPGQAAYVASKGGVLLLGRALAVDWAPFGITVNVVGPGSPTRPCRRRASAIRSAAPGCSARCRSAGPPRRPRSRRWSPSWPPTPPAT